MVINLNYPKGYQSRYGKAITREISNMVINQRSVRITSSSDKSAIE